MPRSADFANESAERNTSRTCAGHRRRGSPKVRHVSSLLGLIEAGLGVAAVPKIALPTRRSSRLVAVPLVEPRVTRTIGLIRRRGRPLAPAAQHLYDLLSAGARPERLRATQPRPSARPVGERAQRRQ
ncbi:MAG: LysR substrate-binding domain-containing protein [Burkholderiaceae bacterium]